MLLVPSITKNLLSFSKLTIDNPLFVEFYRNICFVKDMKGQVLLQGLAQKGVYKLLLKSNSMSPSPISYLCQSELNRTMSILCQSQLNKSMSMLSFTIVSSIFQSCDVSLKASYHSISNNYNIKPDKITLLHRRFGHLSLKILVHLIKSCEHFKVS